MVAELLARRRCLYHLASAKRNGGYPSERLGTLRIRSGRSSPLRARESPHYQKKKWKDATRDWRIKENANIALANLHN